MNFFKNIFKNKLKSFTKTDVEAPEIQENISIDQKFVQNFIQKGGKFLYCSNLDEAKSNLSQILDENAWREVICFENDLLKFLNGLNIHPISKIDSDGPFFSHCESLIAHDGSIMFSSRQLSNKKLKDLPNHFIIFAKTSQISQDTRDGISGIRNRSEKNAATIISSIKDYMPDKADADFMSYGHTNTKTLYLLLLEDL